MYNFMAIWSKLEELLNFEVIATLRDVKNKQTNDERGNERIYD